MSSIQVSRCKLLRKCNGKILGSTNLFKSILFVKSSMSNDNEFSPDSPDHITAKRLKPGDNFTIDQRSISIERTIIDGHHIMIIMRDKFELVYCFTLKLSHYSACNISIFLIALHTNFSSAQRLKGNYGQP